MSGAGESMPDLQASALFRRLEELEEESRRARRRSGITLVASALALGVAGMLLYLTSRHRLPGQVPETVDGRRFVLRDAAGAVRGDWSVRDDGTVQLLLGGRPDGRELTLRLLDDGSAGLSVADSGGKPRLVLGVLGDETASLVFADRTGGPRTVYSLSPSGASSLVFADVRGKTRSAIGVDLRGQAVLTAEAPPGASDSASAADGPAEAAVP